MSAATRSQIDVEVRYVETDQMGVVHHAAYPVWFELARTHHCARSGHRYADIETMGYWLMVTGIDLRYRRGARYGETVQVACWIEEMTSRTLRFAYEVTRGEDRLVTGHTEHLWVRVSDRKPCRIPAELEPAFRRLAGAPVTGRMPEASSQRQESGHEPGGNPHLRARADAEVTAIEPIPAPILEAAVSMS